MLEAGLNVRTHFTPPTDFILPVRAAVKSGRLSMSVVDRRVAEVLAVKFRLGLFDNPYLGDAENADKLAGAEKHRGFAEAIRANSRYASVRRARISDHRRERRGDKD